jgi:outer membrane protein assembly factor BamB
MPNQKSRSGLICRWILAATVCGILPTAALAAGDDTSGPAGVSVPESPGARELLDKARDKEVQKQWKTAAEFYQDALNKYSSRVVPITRDPDKGTYFYSGIAPIVQERISKWPAEGLTVYRNLYGPTAADLLSSAPPGENAALRNIFWNYFVTDAGKSAGLRLIDADLEAGDFNGAAWIGNRLLMLHPLLTADRGMITYRTALAFKWAGDSQQAQSLLNQLKQQSPNDIGSIGGKDMLLVDALASALAAPAPVPTTRPTDADTYPAYGGIGGRGDISPSSAKPGASLNSVQLTPPDVATMIGQNKTQFQNTDQLSLNNNLAMGIMPVVDAGALFFQDGRSVYAVDADSGSPLPGWLNTYGIEHHGQYHMNVFGRARDELLTVAVSPMAVLAVMGQPDHGSLINNMNNGMGMPPQMAGLQPANSTVKLVCLDRDTGREMWTRTPAELPESAAALRTAEYGGTPLIIPAAQSGRVAGSNSPPEDSVLVVARGSKENQFDDCYIVCLSEKTGQYRWSTYVGSATRNFDADGMVSEDPSIMSLASGRVFVMTNLGIVASLDPSDGRLLWLNSYNRDGTDNPEAIMMQRRRGMNAAFGNTTGTSPSIKVWAHNPVFVSDGNVFALPCDTKQLFVYDAGTGQEKKRIAMSGFDNSTVLLGVRDGGVCVNSDKGIYVIDWKKYEEGGDQKTATRWGKPDIAALYDSHSTTDNNLKESPVCGRGFITSDFIFLPTKFRLIQMTWKSGKTVQFYPATGEFNGDQGPGNMLVTAHNVVVAGQTHVDVYTDLSLVKQKYEMAMAASPSDPQPRIAYAEALFSGGKSDSAIEYVDQAINLIGGMNTMRSGKDRGMIFNAMLDFARRAEKNADVDKKQESVAIANQFYDRAAVAADSPLDNATYRLARAAFEFGQKDYASDVKLCQEVLSDEAMRNAALSDDTNAGSSAEIAIDEVLKIDRSIYQPIEDQAAVSLKDARDSHDPNQLLAVATTYPNSKAAIDARQNAVGLFEADNKPDQAITVLRRMYLSSTDSTDRAHILESVANDFLSMPDGVGPAIDRLCRAAKNTPDLKLSHPLHLSDGTTLADITFVEAIAKLRQTQAIEQIARLPDFHLAKPSRTSENPFVRGSSATINNVLAIIHPLKEFNRQDQILTWGANGLSMYLVGATTPSFTIAAVDQQPQEAAWVGGNWLVWTSSQLFQISSDGKINWTFAVDHLPTLVVRSGGDAIVDDAGEPTSDEGIINGQVNVRVIQRNGQLIRIQGGGGGGVAFNRRRVGLVVNPGVAPVVNPVVPVVATNQGTEEIQTVQPGGSNGERILISTSTGRVIALEGRSGQQVWENRLVDHAVDQLLANRHFTVMRLDDGAGAQVAVYDSPTGRLIGKRRFGPEGSQSMLCNVALSEEATLVMTLYGKVVVKDLYDAWKSQPTALDPQVRDNGNFADMTQPDQLIVKAGRVAALYDSGQYLRGYDLSKNSDATNPLQTGARIPTGVSLQMVGPRVFVLTSDQMWQYNLQDPTDNNSTNADIVSFEPKHAIKLMLGKDYAIVLYSPVDRGPAGSPLVMLACFNRAPVKPGSTRESDYGDYCPPIQSHIGITDWAAADGGVYYLTKDGALHLLRGSRP